MSESGLLERIERLVEIGIALSAERDLDRLLENILLGAKAITNADGGTLYAVHDDGTVGMEMVRTDSLAFAMGGTTGEPIPFAPIPLYHDDGSPNVGNVVTYAVLNDRTVNIPDAYAAAGFDLSGTREFDRRTGYRSTSFLTVPMKDHEGTTIGVLQLLNARDDDGGAVVPFSADAQRLAEALASQAAIALTNRRLIDELKALFESLTRLVANAIDEKSPYTAGHCRRVPVLTMQLAEAAHRAGSGPLRDFHLSDDDRYELEVAAWLHDCGKITTPEHVVDKSTKLETIHDRIALVDARFEILRRDAEVAHLRRRLAIQGDTAPDDRAAAEQDFHDTLEELEAERRFLHQVNRGGESMSTADRVRVEAIGRRTWMDGEGAIHPLLEPDEVDNLCIARGTLTEAEREVINNHIVATIDMLEALPFPRHLRRVPEFAGGHHERVDGQGYPKGLRGDQMSVQARMMAIADVFEALTARDRPYKPGKTLSESLTILARMRDDGHIDPELFEVFVREEAYLEYAREHLTPEQVDAVDPEALLG